MEYFTDGSVYTRIGPSSSRNPADRKYRELAANDRRRCWPRWEGSSMSGRVLPFDPAAHKVADVLLPWFVNGTLEKDELAFVQQHLSACARCQRAVQWLGELRAACVDGEATPGASTVFRNLSRQLDQPRAGRGKGASLARLWRRAPSWSRWAMAAQLAAIVAMG